MREIIFRGKDTWGNWQYGIVQTYSEDFVVIASALSFNKQVDPESVGQFTGLTDKNGTKIFEGDIVMFGFNPCVIKYDIDNARFMLYVNGKHLQSGFNVDTMKQKEVIGNITDNPELLEVKANA